MSPKGSTRAELPALGVVLTAPQPNPERTSGEQRRRLSPGPLLPSPPRVRLSPYRGHRVLPRLAAHAGTPCPPGATLTAASCPAHAGRGCTRELGYVRPVRLRACRTCPPQQLRAPEACHPSRSRGCTPRPLNPSVRGSRPQRKAAFTEGTWPCSPEGQRPGGFLGPGSSRRGQTSPDPDPDTEEKGVLT